MIIRKNGGGLKAFTDSLKKLNEKSVGVGVTRSSNASVDGGMNMAGLLYIHEFGAQIKVTEKMRGYLAYTGLFLKKTTKFINIPERSVLRSVAQENAKKYQARIGDLTIKAAESGRSMDDVLNAVGLEVSNDVKRKFSDGLTPNSEYTAKRKGSSAPLVNTGELRNSITWEVK